MQRRWLLSGFGLTWAAVLAAVLWGQQPISYQKEVEPIFVQACGDCHGSDNPKKGLDLSPGKGHGQLVNVKSQEIPELLRVKPGDPANSYLWHKLTHTQREGKGMPRTIFGAKKLPEAQLELIRRWIETGAQP